MTTATNLTPTAVLKQGNAKTTNTDNTTGFNELIGDMPKMRIEIEILGLERITWLVHPSGNVRCLLRVEWLGT